MMSTKTATLVAKVLALILVGALSFFWFSTWFPEREFVRESIESVEDSRDTVFRFAAATLTASLAITALPDDFGTTYAAALTDMNFFFTGILLVLLLENMLILFGIKLAFRFAIPIACIIGAASVLLKRKELKSLAVRLSILGLAVALVIPCSTHVTDYVAADLKDYVETTITETVDGADKLNEAAEGGADEKTFFEKLSDLFQTAINSISDLLTHCQNAIRRCMTSIAILVLTNCVMPLLNFFVLKWVLKETFHIAIPTPRLRRPRSDSDSDFDFDSDSDSDTDAGLPEHELMIAGE